MTDHGGGRSRSRLRPPPEAAAVAAYAQMVGATWKAYVADNGAAQPITRPTADRVYVGRPSKWGNPFMIGRDGTRDQVIAKYCVDRCQPALLADLHELRGKDLVCRCAPRRCQAEVLAELADR